MTYTEITRPVIEQSQPVSVQSIIQDIVTVESSVRDALSKVAPALGRSITREPPVDILDEGDKLLIIVDVPGVPKDNIRVRVTIDTVEISAIPTTPIASTGNGKVLRAERLANFKLFRRIVLPCKVRIGDARAYLKDGVLYIYLPKLSDTTESIDLSIE